MWGVSAIPTRRVQADPPNHLGIEFEFTTAEEVSVCEIVAELGISSILVVPGWDAVADGSRPFHVYCNAFIDGFGAELEQEESWTTQCGPSLTLAALPSIPRGTGPRSAWKLAALSGPSNAFEATFGAQRFASFRITRRSKASAKCETTLRESSGGSSYSPRSPTLLNTARATPTEMPASYPACQSLSRSTTSVDLAASPLSLIHI